MKMTIDGNKELECKKLIKGDLYQIEYPDGKVIQTTFKSATLITMWFYNGNQLISIPTIDVADGIIKLTHVGGDNNEDIHN